jgi:cytochrome P450
VAFGFGIHGCVGSALARAELRIGIETLLERIGSWRLDPDHPPVRGGNLIVRTHAQLPILW